LADDSFLCYIYNLKFAVTINYVTVTVKPHLA